MATPVFVSVGTAASGTGNITPGLPASIVAGDLLIMIAEYSYVNNATVNATSDWTILGTGTYETGSDIKIWGLFYTGTAPSTLLTESNATDLDHTIAQIVAYRNVDNSLGVYGSGPPNFNDQGFFTTFTGTTTGSGTALTYPSVTTKYSNQLILLVNARNNDSNTVTSGLPTNAALSAITERIDTNTNALGGGGIALSEGLKATAGSTGTSSGSISATGNWGTITIALRPSGNRVLPCSTATYTLTRNDANLIKPKFLPITVVSFTLNRIAASLFRGFSIPLTAQAFTLTGPPTVLFRITASKDIILDPPPGWAVHVITDISQATDPACIYFGLSVSIGQQILYKTTTENTAASVTINSQGFVQVA